MKVQTEKLPGSIARLEIELEQEQVDREVERAYKRLANRVLVPGFRRGKAPRVLVERSLGEGALLNEAAREFVPSAIANALEQEKLDPIGEPEDYNLLEEQPFRFEVKVPLVPSVTLGDYRAIRAERNPVEITDERVQEVLDGLRDSRVEWVTPEPPRGARDGDQLVIDVEDSVEGEPLSQQEDVTITLGEGQLLNELESQLEGVEEGQEYEFTAILPEEGVPPQYAGKEATFKVNVKSVKEKHLPELNDEFASTMGANISTVDELRTRIRENLRSQAEQEERDRLLQDIMDKTVATAQVDVPDVLVERELDHQIAHLEETLGNSNLTMEQYTRATGESVGEIRERMRDSARASLTQKLVMSEVARAENIAVDDSEVEAQIDRMTKGIAEAELAQTREMLGRDDWQGRIRSDLYDRKLVNRIVEIATGEPLYPEPQAEEPAGEDTEAPVVESMAGSEVPAEAGDTLVAEAATEAQAVDGPPVGVEATAELVEPSAAPVATTQRGEQPEQRAGS